MIKAGIYRHIETNSLYNVLPLQLKIQVKVKKKKRVNGKKTKWIDSILYQRKEEAAQYFGRSEKKFKKKFTYVGL